MATSPDYSPVCSPDTSGRPADSLDSLGPIPIGMGAAADLLPRVAPSSRAGRAGCSASDQRSAVDRPSAWEGRCGLVRSSCHPERRAVGPLMSDDHCPPSGRSQLIARPSSVRRQASTLSPCCEARRGA